MGVHREAAALASAPNILGLDRRFSLCNNDPCNRTERISERFAGEDEALAGDIPGVTTKFTSRDQIDVAEMERCIALQVDAGVHGLVVGGSLGEGSSLDMIEKTEILKSALRVAGGKIPDSDDGVERLDPRGLSLRGSFRQEWRRWIDGAARHSLQVGRTGDRGAFPCRGAGRRHTRS